MVRRRRPVAERGVAEMMDVLNEGLHRRATDADPGLGVCEPGTVEIIAGQSLPQHRHQRPISR